MKIIDKFLKKLKTDRNTFATYILSLISAYIAVDRLVEMLLMIFTGASYSYWGPIKYTLALACPVFAYAFLPSSKFAINNKYKVTYFYVYIVVFYIIAVSMFTQWLNMGTWLLLMCVPDYTELITDFSELVKPALISISLYLPLVTIYPFFKWVYFTINDDPLKIRSIWDFRGINLADSSVGHGPYTCEVYICTDHDYNKKIILNETSRFQSLLVCGGSGSGKTSLIYEPLIAKDIERKHFFRETSKELGLAALKTKIAVLNRPYDNDYLNKNFNLNMLRPVEGRENLLQAYLGKMSLGTILGETVYRNLGLSLVAPDYEIIQHMTDVCKNFGVEYDIIDPSNASTSIGLNPFVYDNPYQIATTISSILDAMYLSNLKSSFETYIKDAVIQALENICILLKEMYPRMNQGSLPNLEDLLKLVSDFELIEKMCEIMTQEDDLKEKYSTQLNYFKKNFYRNSHGREMLEKYMSTISDELNNLLQVPSIKSILCNRHNNINFDEALATGKITFVCTRRGELGASSHKILGLFYLISMQEAVLRRPGTEATRIPHFLYIDEFADFICNRTEAMFTLYRKYKVGPIISIQTLSQLDVQGSEKDYKYRSVILSNCANKIFTGNAGYDEVDWWSNEFGSHREWSYSNNMDAEKLQYDPKYGSVKWTYVANIKTGKLQAIGQKQCGYKIRNDSGKPMCGVGDLQFLSSKYKEPQKIKNYDFGKYSDGVTTATEDDTNTRKKFDLKHLDFLDENNEFNPVQTDVTDSKYLFDNQDAIIVNLKRGNPNSGKK